MQKTIQIDNQGRCNLGKKRKGSRYSVVEKTNGEIVLTPVIEIPINEQWIWENPEIARSILQGIEQAKRREFVEDPRKDLDDEEWLAEIDEDAE